MRKMPVLFVGHGSPMNAIEQNPFTETWRALPEKLQTPKAILSVSAHWFTHGTRICDAPFPKMVYDMYGFPEELYKVVYPAPGAPDFARETMALLPVSASVDNSWGFDHGTWSVLRVIYPEAKIPVYQLSVDAYADMSTHYAIGRALAPLREKGVMIFASGNVVHNLSRVSWNMEGGFPWAREFDGYMRENILARADENAISFERAGAPAHLAVPTPDHFAPLLYALGATDAQDEIFVFNNACTLGALSMTGYLFGGNG